MALFAVMLAFTFVVDAQQAPPLSPPSPPSGPPRVPDTVTSVFRSRSVREDSELSIAVGPKANIKLCVGEASVKVNGWARSEVRVFVRGGMKFQFRVLERDKSSDLPSWVWVTRSDNTTGNECISADEIEMDVPTDSVLTIDGRSTNVVIDSVARTEVKIVEGNILMRNITGGVRATTYQGNLLLENSGGTVSLESTTGHIAAVGVESGQVGDVFRAKTASGGISIREVSYRQLQVNSISGSLTYDGKLLPGGVYSFKTSNGSILMTLPEDISARFNASYGFGSFQTAFPISVTQKTDMPGSRTFVGTCGEGEANVTLQTVRGSIGLAKKE
ncbi:MAG: DUF4097 family beta strand repeat protein [Acidobacteria bacterium]|nr:DUF4097 family beta strand repeat protein [Acidobacteriota bacterium]